MGTKVSIPYVPDKTRDRLFQDVDTSLASFFERPIVARTYSWTPLQVGSFTAIFNPWNDFFGNPRVINRINNYNLLRAKLHVRFMINGNGFYYGRLMADYVPLHTYDNVTSAATIIPENAIQASQRMKVFIDPSTCCSNELELPFVYYADGVSIPTAGWGELGTIYIRELQGLKHANAATQPLTITVMVWATDVQMSLPTSHDSSALVAQAGDEYSSAGPVEAAATAVANMASAVTEVPIIGRYARATEMAARATSKAASVMGWSRPSELAPHMNMHAKPISDLAPSGAGDNSSKLSVDVKQEVTVDPNVIGIDLPDELSIASIAARESFLTPFPWATAQTAGTLLWTARVTPVVGPVVSGYRYIPACMFATIPFQYWRAKMRYRFQIVASAYHKGKVRIVWDPSYVQSLESNVQFTRIIDIAEERDITVEVDWGQAQHFMDATSHSDSETNYRVSPQYTSSNPRCNGVISLYVLNELATPNSTVNNDIAVNVFVSAIDFQVAAPTQLPLLCSSYGATVQAGDDEMVMDGSEPGCGPTTATYQMGTDNDDANEMSVYFGERIVSFRQVLKRFNLHTNVAINAVGSAMGSWTATFSDVPFNAGYSNHSLHATSTAGKFSYVQQTLLQYLMPAFVGMRGSMRSKYVVWNSTGVQQITVRRRPGALATIPGSAVAYTNVGPSQFARAATLARDSLVCGGATTLLLQNGCVEVEHPYYKPVRFDLAKSMLQDSTTVGVASPFRNAHDIEFMVSNAANAGAFSRYISVGEDFSLFWFQGCPPLTVTPTPLA